MSDDPVSAMLWIRALEIARLAQWRTSHNPAEADLMKQLEGGLFAKFRSRWKA